MSAGWSPQARLYTTPAAFALRASRGPASASASTLTITMCLPWAIALKAWRMPAAGTPVASTITSISGQAISASASSVTCVVPRASAFASEGAEIASSFQPAERSWRRARETSRSATATRCIPSVKRTWETNMVPNLPAPIRPTVTGRNAACRSSSMAWRFTARSEHSNPNAIITADEPRAVQHNHGAAQSLRYCCGSRRRANRPCVRRFADDRRPVGLLAHRARHKNLGRTFRIVRRAALEQNLHRAFMLRLGVEAFAGLESLAAAGGSGGRLAIGGAVLRHGAALAHGHDARVRQSHDRVGRILGGVAGVLAELIECRLRALQIRLELARGFVEPMADRIDEAWAKTGIRRWIGGGLDRGRAWDLARGPDLLRGRGRDQAKRARGHHRARDGCERASLKYFRMAGHPGPVDVTAARRLGGTRGKNEERRNFKTDRGRR